MTKRDLSEQELEALFAARQADVPPVSDAFLARIGADAARVAAEVRAEVTAEARRPATPPQRAGLLDWFWSLSAPGGVVAAGLIGLWIGLSGPQAVPDPALLWPLTDEVSALSDEVWLGMQDLDSMEWDDG